MIVWSDLLIRAGILLIFECLMQTKVRQKEMIIYWHLAINHARIEPCLALTAAPIKHALKALKVTNQITSPLSFCSTKSPMNPQINLRASKMSQSGRTLKH